MTIIDVIMVVNHNNNIFMRSIEAAFRKSFLSKVLRPWHRNVPMDCSQFNSIFFKGIHYCGYWPDHNETFLYKLFGLFSFSFFCVTYNISILMGAISVANLSDGIFLFGHFLQISIVSLRISMLYWNRNQINQMLLQFYQSQQNYDNQMQRKFEILNKICRIFALSCLIGITACYCVPIFTYKRFLPLAIWFPLDWKNDLSYYILGYCYVIISHTILSIAQLVSVLSTSCFLNQQS